MEPKKNKKLVLIILLMLLLFGVLVVGLVFWQNDDDYEEEIISPYFLISLTTIEELNIIRELFEQEIDSKLLPFVQQAGGGHSTITNRREVERFLNVLETLPLPTNPNWTSFHFSNAYGILLIRYENLLDGADLIFMIDYELNYSFSGMVEEFYATYVFNNVTERILGVVENLLVDADYLVVGRGIEIFEVYPHGTESRFIIENEYGFEVGVILNVANRPIEATVHGAPNLEAAFEVLANIMITLNP